jgi:hypothetical protein
MVLSVKILGGVYISRPPAVVRNLDDVQPIKELHGRAINRIRGGNKSDQGLGSVARAQWLAVMVTVDDHRYVSTGGLKSGDQVRDCPRRIPEVTGEHDDEIVLVGIEFTYPRGNSGERPTTCRLLADDVDIGRSVRSFEAHHNNLITCVCCRLDRMLTQGTSVHDLHQLVATEP